MIHHISIAANEPLATASTLARFWQTEALPFPMYPGSYIVFLGPDTGCCIEIYPAGQQLTPSTPELPALAPVSQAPGGAFHAAISTGLDESAIRNICAEPSWFCQTGPRGPFFHVVEVWVENHTLLELLTPDMTEAYRGFANFSNWKATFGTALQDDARRD